MVMAAVLVDAVDGDCTRVGLERGGEIDPSLERGEEVLPLPLYGRSASGWWNEVVLREAESADGTGARVGDVLVEWVGVGTKLETRTEAEIACTG